MAEALKAMYDREFLGDFAGKVRSAYPAFQAEDFVATIMDDAWEGLELKARIRRIATVLGEFLPSSYPAALEVLFSIDEDCTGFPYLFFPDFVEVYGQDPQHWDLSMGALERFTQRSSSEFAVRPFILRDPQRMMNQMLIWSQHPNEHVRRLASEGCRPRLPWGQALAPFKKDPSPVLPVLEQLKEDPSLYVRKSVANNLNDIAKDHPDIVIRLAKAWLGNHPDTDWIVRHACRTLIRKAEPDIMRLFGYSGSSEGNALVQSAVLAVEPKKISIGDHSMIHYELSIREGTDARLRIEYGIYFVKANGQTSRKLFLLSDKTVPGGSKLTGRRKHGWSDLTTRRHYPGEHRIVLVVNGEEVAEDTLWLKA